MNVSQTNTHNEKAVRLVDYLQKLAHLRKKLVQDIDEYGKENILWLNDIPHEKECFTQAWGSDEEYDSDIWIEVRNRLEPALPTVPGLCKDWIDKSVLRKKNDLPELKLQIKIEKQNPAWNKESNLPESIYIEANLKDRPNVQKEWDKYVDEQWLPWVEDHNSWEKVHKVYSSLFAIHQQQLRLGEEFELILGLGILIWQTPSGQHVRRHLIVANAILEFEARLGKFTIKPNPDGANVRPELDMLDIEEQPIGVEERAKESLTDPWARECVEGVLKFLVHSIDSRGEYEYILEAQNILSTTKPIVRYSPAIILRKRSTKGLTETLEKIKERIEKGEYLPPNFRDIAEIQENVDIHNTKDPGNVNSEFDNEVFFPKPSNEEQRRIVDKIRTASGVLVQGPPGTGKSHTIANLICHLLATGKRILVTAQTPRALQVLQNLVPEEIRPLCINLLGSGLEEKRSLESSVRGILLKNQDWKEEKANHELENIEKNLRQLREEKAEIDRRLRAIRESETISQTIANGAYKGTAAQIAQDMNINRNTYEWFVDKVSIDQECPFSEKTIEDILKNLRLFTPEKRQELNLDLPDNLQSDKEFADIVNLEKSAIEEENQLVKLSNDQITQRLLKLNDDKIKEIIRLFSEFLSKIQSMRPKPQPWMQQAVKDVAGDNFSMWQKIYEVTQNAIYSTEPLIDIADDNKLENPKDFRYREIFKDADELKNHLNNGGKLGWWWFRPSLVKKRIYLIKDVYINGRPCDNSERIEILADISKVHVEFEKCREFWANYCNIIDGPFALKLQYLKTMRDALDDCLKFGELIEQCRNVIIQFNLLPEPDWSDELQIKKWINSCKLALSRNRKRLVLEEIKKIEEPIVRTAAKQNPHPISQKLLDSIRERDIALFEKYINWAQNLNKQKQTLGNLDDDLKTMEQRTPKLIRDLIQTCSETYWETRIRQIREAWAWAQARIWVEEYTNKGDAPSLDRRAIQIEDEIGSSIAKIASIRAWSFCFSRIQEDHRRHMESWNKSMGRLGKGTGKHAPTHRKDAQRHLNECREAVPAWVMPLYRVWDTIDPIPEMFDVIIVDEASQCGFEALPLFYLGKKILIVGDDKQISPELVGLSREKIFEMRDRLLCDFKFKSSFDVESSLFDHGKIRYGISRITLREHFRCMPEIIRFGNDLCYSDTPLVPLRQYGCDRLTPTVSVFVDKGYREGSDSRTINRPEADSIVEKIAELCKDPKYYEKSMGVIVLQGDAQTGLIEKALLEKLGAEEIEKRRLVCGNPYTFQGDERDIIFLSMVAAPNKRIGPLTKASDERRFNVATSRARDQMYLFHSVTLNDLSTSCLRRRLLEFFTIPMPQEIAGIKREELEQKSINDNRSIVKPPQPFDSWFEVDVALELMRKGFYIIPQFEVARKRIDLVIEVGNSRMAVECDGDKWHGPDKYDDDMQRERMLRRCGWEFFRIRASSFYSNKEKSLSSLWQMLEERRIIPRNSILTSESSSEDNWDTCKMIFDKEPEKYEEEKFESNIAKNLKISSNRTGRRVEMKRI